MYVRTGRGLGQATTMPMETITPAAARLTGFNKNSAKLKDFHSPQIDSVADRIVTSWKTGTPIFTVKVKGHSSSEGPAQYNVGLALHRALAVRKALQKALERKQKNLSYKVLVLAQSKGSREPIDTNETEEGRLQNRRVEVFLSTKALLPLPAKKPPAKKTPGQKTPAGVIRPEEIPWIRPELPGHMLPPDTEPLCDQPSYQKEIERCKQRLRSAAYQCFMTYAEKEATAAGAAVGFAAGIIGLALTGVGIPAAVILALLGGVPIGVLSVAARVQVATCVDGEIQRYHQCVNEAKARWHCL